MDMTITFPGGKRVDASLDGHTVRTDQPSQSGGTGSAPEPFTTFLASIGTCAGIYVLGFCQTRGIDTQGLRLIQHNEFDQETHRLRRVAIDVIVPSGFPEKYLASVQRAADQCLVKKTILDPPEFSVRTVTGGNASVPGD